MTSVLGPGDI